MGGRSRAIATVVIAGVAAMANVQGAEVADRSEAADSAYGVNDPTDRQNRASEISKVTNETVVPAKQPSTAGGMADNPAKADHKRHFGIGGGPRTGIIGLDMTPVKDFMRVNPDLCGKNFDMHQNSRYNVFFTMGGMGYLYVGNGVLLGGGGAGGEHHYRSDRFAQDSSMSLSVKAEYGGFIVEKAFDRGYCNFHAGMQIGAGSLRVKYRVEEGSAFHAVNASRDGDADRESVAPFNLFEVHGGVTYSLASFVHIGADISVPMFHSAGGFDAYTSGFATVNPAFAVRLMLGNKG